jgi:predicted extracellular nuclease
MPRAGWPGALAAVAAAVLLGCDPPARQGTDDRPAAGDPPSALILCETESIPITRVQGGEYRSPLVGVEVTVRGVVTRIEPARGFYLEDTVTAETGSSRALFVTAAADNLPAVGETRTARGPVAEAGDGRDTLTTVTGAELSANCGDAAGLPLTRRSLPRDSRSREALEGMRVALDEDLVLTDVYNAHRGEWTLASGAALRIPTEDAPPGVSAAEIERDNRSRELEVALPPGELMVLPAGTAVDLPPGVMGHDGREQRLMLESAPTARAPVWPAPPPPAGNALRIVSLNLLNFFNGDGRGGGFPTERGAGTPAEFEQQQMRTRAALAQLRPDLLAVQELENDGFGEASAAHSLLALLNDAGAGAWAVVDSGTGPIGGDLITVGLFYRQEVLAPAGPPALLRATPFQGLSRQPLAQRFRHGDSGAEFWIVVNHLKSKGSCPETGPNRDRDDGQGCWNPARVEAVNALSPWLEELARTSGTPQVLIVGDMNAWRQEDPIRAFRHAGWTELVETRSGLPQYSYLYFGQRGTLDYAFASPALVPAARRAVIWHIDADMPRDLPLPQPWLRTSDHDPVVVDLDFSQAATSD